jgi:hypothetical protein
MLTFIRTKSAPTIPQIPLKQQVLRVYATINPYPEMTMYALLKALISGILVSVVSETARRNPALGALIASLPLISVMGMIWLWRDTHDVERLAVHAQSTFWYVLPSLPMFLALPAMLRAGVPFYAAMTLSCLLTVVLYLAMVWGLKRFGISL